VVSAAEDVRDELGVTELGTADEDSVDTWLEEGDEEEVVGAGASVDEVGVLVLVGLLEEEDEEDDEGEEEEEEPEEVGPSVQNPMTRLTLSSWQAT